MSDAIRCIAMLLLAGLVSHAQAATHTITGLVVGVADGDTLTLLDAGHHQHKVRLEGIDAPEKSQAFGSASKRSLSDMAFKREAVAECGKTDKYQREVCRVLVDGVDVCLVQVQDGMAWHFKRYAKEQSRPQREQYGSAELQARASRRGLWADAEPVAPWDWRALKKAAR